MQEKIESIRSNEEIGVKLMNAWEEKIYDREDGRKEGWEMGIREGRKEGQKEKQDQIIAKMKQKLSDEEIAELTGIPKEEIEAVPKG